MTADFLLAVPVIRVAAIERAHAFYCDRLGFSRDWLYQLHDDQPDPAYMSLTRGEARVHVSSFSGDGVIGAVTSFYVSNVDALFAEYRARDVKIDLEPIAQTWGTREMYLQDPDGNKLRFYAGAAGLVRR